MKFDKLKPNLQELNLNGVKKRPPVSPMSG